MAIRTQTKDPTGKPPITQHSRVQRPPSTAGHMVHVTITPMNVHVKPQATKKRPQKPINWGDQQLFVREKRKVQPPV